MVGQAVAALGPDTNIAAGLTAVLTAFIGSISFDPYRAKADFVEVLAPSPPR
ncbi:hypothetical protein ACIBG0_23625 [Nocardia sp. NPDC050630]|uniref:hypothetical protein n=1 Tax=Nocardia sp. NPDC050630 TaxID=3364321 RepID=UPI0037AC9ADD